MYDKLGITIAHVGNIGKCDHCKSKISNIVNCFIVKNMNGVDREEPWRSIDLCYGCLDESYIIVEL